MLMKKLMAMGLMALSVIGMSITAQARYEIGRDSTGNGYTAYYDDGSYLIYNARGDSYTYYDPEGRETTWDGNQSERASDSSRQEQKDLYRNCAVTYAYWDYSNGKCVAKWSADKRSKAKFSITLYRDDWEVTTKNSSSGNSYDFTNIIAKQNRTGDYTFIVEATWPGPVTDYEESDILSVNSSRLDAIVRKYRGNSGSSSGSSSYSGASSPSPGVAMVGWQYSNNTWKYVRADGRYACNGWEHINGKWYYFDANYIMASNRWIMGQNGLWYYVGMNGDMLVNQWVRSAANEHIWYYVGADGAMVTNTTINGLVINAAGECYM